MSGAPLGLVVEEDDACQSRGVAAAVRQGLVEASSVLEGLRQYAKVVVPAFPRPPSDFVSPFPPSPYSLLINLPCTAHYVKLTDTAVRDVTLETVTAVNIDTM